MIYLVYLFGDLTFFHKVFYERTNDPKYPTFLLILEEAKAQYCGSFGQHQDLVLETPVTFSSFLDVYFGLVIDKK